MSPDHIEIGVKSRPKLREESWGEIIYYWAISWSELRKDSLGDHFDNFTGSGPKIRYETAVGRFDAGVET